MKTFLKIAGLLISTFIFSSCLDEVKEAAQALEDNFPPPEESSPTESNQDETPEQAPGPTKFTASLIAGYEQTLRLKYDNQFVGTSCSIVDPVGLTINQACSCLDGVCSAEVATPSTSGYGSFSYTVTDGVEQYQREAELNIKDINAVKMTFRIGNVSYGDGDLTLTLPLVQDYRYDFTIDWGDGNSSVVTSYNDPDIEHTYASAGDYSITILGQVEAWSFDAKGDKDKLISVEELGTVGWVNLDSAFDGCSNLTTVFGGDTSNVVNMARMFYDAVQARPDTSTWNTGNVTRISSMFNGATVATPDTSNWDTSNMKSISWAFRDAIAANPNTSNWDTSNVTDMSGVFYNAESATPDTGGWNTSKVTNMGFMFHNADIATPNTSNWDTSKVTDMINMFTNAELADPDTSNWDVSNVTRMSNLFYGTDSANPDTSNWNTSKVIRFNGMFWGSKVADPDVRNWDLSSAKVINQMFKNSKANPDVSQWDTSGVENMFELFRGASRADPDMSNWDFSSVTSVKDMFYGVTISTYNYDTYLIRLDATASNGLSTTGGGSTYTSAGAGGTARANLIGKGWTITDGGGI